MKNMTAFAVLCCLSVSGQALAAATPDQAKAIATALEAYTGGVPGVVTVTPKGDDYEISLDAKPYLNRVSTPGFSAEIKPYVMLARPNGDGTWNVSSDSTINFSMKSEPLPELSYTQASMSWHGVFDEKLAALTSSEYAIGPSTITEVLKDPSGVVSHIAMALQASNSKVTGSDGGNGGVNLEQVMSLSGLSGSVQSEPPAGGGDGGAAAALNYNFAMPEVKYVTALKGFKSKAVLDLLAFMIAHGDKTKMIADQAQFKEKILAALPLWDNVDSNATLGKMTFNTAMGAVSVDAGGAGATMSGVSEKGMFREAFNFSGVTIPAGLAPPWSDGLIPHTFKLDFTVDGFNLDAPARLAIAQADFAKDPPLPENSNMMFLPAFAPNNGIGLSFKDGEISAPDFKFTYDGAFNVSFAGFPSGTATLHMTGLETVISKVQAATANDPNAQQTMGGLVALKGFGKAEADGSMSWAIDVKPEGKVFINGIDVSAMMGLAPPPQQ
jgi:hypothetical protein